MRARLFRILKYFKDLQSSKEKLPEREKGREKQTQKGTRLYLGDTGSMFYVVRKRGTLLCST